jgi:probable HAF family extracellular repeat protein
VNRLVLLAAVLASLAACTDPSAVSVPRPNAQAVSAPDPADAIDLGTLGGNSTTPRALNNGGQVVGTSVAADGQAHPFVWEAGTMRELPLLPGTRPEVPFPEIGGDAQAISNTGLIAGLSYNQWDARMVLWDSSGVHDLAAPTAFGLPISRFARVIRITDVGDILATVVLHDGPPPFSYPVLWQGGIAQRLPALLASDRSNTAAAMNNRGQVIGAATSAYGYQDDVYRHPVLWTAGAIQDLGVLRAGGDTPECYDPRRNPDGFCTNGTATDISDRGDVVGYVTDTTHLVRPFLWRDGQLGDLGVLPGMNAYAIASNERGQVAGYGGGRLVSFEGGEGFAWQDGQTQLLGSLGGGGTVVVAMNQRGEIVGSSLTAAGERHAFIWSDGIMTDLGLGPQGGGASIAIAVNARGDVLGVSGTPWFPRSFSLSSFQPTRGVLWPHH